MVVSCYRFTPCSKSFSVLYSTKYYSLSSSLYDCLAYISLIILSFCPCINNAGIFPLFKSWVSFSRIPLSAITPAGTTLLVRAKCNAMVAPCPIPPTYTRCWGAILLYLPYFQNYTYLSKCCWMNLWLLFTWSISISYLFCPLPAVELVGSYQAAVSFWVYVNNLEGAWSSLILQPE